MPCGLKRSASLIGKKYLITAPVVSLRIDGALSVRYPVILSGCNLFNLESDLMALELLVLMMFPDPLAILQAVWQVLWITPGTFIRNLACDRLMHSLPDVRT
jgi:hypothetical protein